MGHHHDHADDENEEEYEEEHSHGGGFLSGALLGVLLGLGVGLLMAPAAGRDTRHKLADRAASARDQAMQAAEDTRAKAVQVAEEARAKAKDLQHTGREMLEENKRRIERTAEAVKQSAQEAWTSSDNGEHVDPTPVAPAQANSMYNLMGQAGKPAAGGPTGKPSAP